MRLPGNENHNLWKKAKGTPKITAMRRVQVYKPNQNSTTSEKRKEYKKKSTKTEPQQYHKEKSLKTISGKKTS